MNSYACWSSHAGCRLCCYTTTVLLRSCTLGYALLTTALRAGP